MKIIRRFQTSTRCYQWFKKGLINPLGDLQQDIQVPVLNEEHWIFKPTYSDVENVQSHFKPSKSKPIVPLRGVGDFTELPTLQLPEVAFIGRSNVGKSSLIKALFHNPRGTNIRISKSPGHTNAVKVYCLDKLFALVDMPGYGHNMPNYFRQSVEAYLQNRKNLVRTFLLLDSSAGVTDVDKIGFDMVEEFRIPYAVIMTKIDKNNGSSVYRSLDKFSKFREKELSMCFPQPFLVSAKEDCGICLLRAFIAHVTGNFDY